MHFESSLNLLSDNKSFILEKRILLLKTINKTGSISKAAKEIPMSYKAAWEAINDMNNLCPSFVVKKETGGSGGGGTTLTEYGENLIKSYDILKTEHNKFLNSLTNITDFNTGNLKSLKRVAMQLSARNQIITTIDSIIIDKVNASVNLSTKNNKKLVSSISRKSVENLSLKIDDEVIAIFKSNNVMISTKKLAGLSARNKIEGIIKSINYTEVSCEVMFEISKNETITSVITTRAAKELKLEIGMKAFAIIKASDIMIGN